MPARKAKVIKPKITVESDSEEEVVNNQAPPNILIESDSEEEIPIKKQSNKSNKNDNVINFDNYEFNTNTIFKYCDFINDSYKNYSLDKIKEVVNKIDEVKESIIDKKNLNQRTIQELHQENCLLSDIENSIQDIVSNINKHEEKLKKEAKLKAQEMNKVAQVNQVIQVIPNNKIFTTIKDLSNALTNEHQQAILWRINNDSEGSKVYLQNFLPNADKKKKTLLGTINILGNYNRSKGIREAYDVKVFKDDPKGSFWCSCADHKFNSGKKNIVCKHICFIVCKVLKINQTYFFEPAVKTLSNEHLEQLLAKFSDNSDMWKDKQYVRKSDFITIDDFKIFPKPISDTCTFCYDEMTDADKDIACACPICKHCFHEECMGVWLEAQDKCSFCSNNFWTYYKRIKAGETKINVSANKL
jgi:hypothetical protein